MHNHPNTNSICCDHDCVLPEINCEFCSELANPVDSRFKKLYGSVVSRTVVKDNGFVVMPTIGQLFEASMLVLPEQHIERMADLGKTQIRECIKIVEKVVERLSMFGNPIIFEHGARAVTGGGCGIFHAHFHVVPVPIEQTRPRIEHIMPACAVSTPASSLLDALHRLKHVDEYLLLQDANGQVAFLEVTPTLKPSIPSQFFRQSLVARYELSVPWDWRLYGFEPRLVSTIGHFQSSAS
jgi:diadenosine tetraphosphate (Ap4A) HIT family hydrolase